MSVLMAPIFVLMDPYLTLGIAKHVVANCLTLINTDKFDFESIISSHGLNFFTYELTDRATDKPNYRKFMQELKNAFSKRDKGAVRARNGEC